MGNFHLRKTIKCAVLQRRRFWAYPLSETPNANLVAGVRWLLSIYTIRAGFARRQVVQRLARPWRHVPRTGDWSKMSVLLLY